MMKLRQYFERIDYRGERKPSLATLNALQRRHVLTIPFENLDVQLGRPVTTQVESAYDKLVTRKRGGWCYEQNGLFGWALREIGFDVTRVAAAVMRQDRGASSTANHLCLLVRIPGDQSNIYLADVGFGGSLLKPLELREAETLQQPFRVGLRRLADGHWQFFENAGDSDFTYDFLAEAGDEEAMSAKCTDLQSNPASNFVLNLVAQRRTSVEHKTLRGKIFRVTSAGGVRSQELASARELVATLRDEFSLDVPEAAGVWPRIVERHDEYLRELLPS